MDKIEARTVLTQHLAKYRSRPYAELLTMIGKTDCVEVDGPSGQAYQIEVNIVWDSKACGNVRVFAAIDDGGLRTAIAPLCADFIKSSDGSLVGEG